MPKNIPSQQLVQTEDSPSMTASHAQLDSTPHTHASNSAQHIARTDDSSKERYLLQFHKEVRYGKMSGPKKQETLHYAYEAAVLMQRALPLPFNQTRYLRLLPPSKKDSGFYDFSNFMRLGILRNIAFEKEGFLATYFHEYAHMTHYTATESPFVDVLTAEKHHALFQLLIEEAMHSQTIQQLCEVYPPTDFRAYLLSAPEMIARMIESYCLHTHDLAAKTAKNRIPYWQFTAEEVQRVPHVLAEIYPATRSLPQKPTTLTIYLDIDGVLQTSLSQELAFDEPCMRMLRKIIALCKKQYPTIQLCIISEWRFDKTAEDIMAQLQAHHVLELVEDCSLPTPLADRTEQILQHQLAQPGHFIILDHEEYEHPYLIKHHFPLSPLSGLAVLDSWDIKSYISF